MSVIWAQAARKALEKIIDQAVRYRLIFKEEGDFDMMAMSDAERHSWEVDGYFIRRGFAKAQAVEAMCEEMIDLIRADPPSAHEGAPAYAIDQALLVQPEAKVPTHAKKAEDFVAKVFNAHLIGHTRDFAHSQDAAQIVGELLGPDIDVFQTQFILKNPGAWGQPWHQDSHYFNFDHQPQIGLWLALSEATLENGCLHVIPGSHKRPIQPHEPDPRPGANQGYLEIMGLSEERSVPVTMEQGDLLVFHSFLIHRSTDNVAATRRAAMVYHFGRAGTVNLAGPEVQKLQNMVTRWVPVLHDGQTVAA
jgi:phytanoyl-CoA hydroxylase